jgi:hypothetical protein
LHSIPPVGVRSDSTAAGRCRWPRDERDRELVEAAYDAGCHAFLTGDKGILRCHSSLSTLGLAILTPGQLLDALDGAGELDETRGGHFVLPDLSTLSRLYAGFSDS